MTRTRSILVVVTLLGLLALGGVALATPFDVRLGLDTRIDGGDARRIGRSVSAVGPSVRMVRGLTMNDLIGWKLASTHVSEPSSALLLGLGLLGLAVLSGRKFDERDSAPDSSTR